MAFLIKLALLVFCLAVSVDSFRRINKIREDVERQMITRKTGEMLENRARRTGIVFALAAAGSVALFFINIAALGE
jgi:hypothetical protein